jgi:hypothetical protein
MPVIMMTPINDMMFYIQTHSQISDHFTFPYSRLVVQVGFGVNVAMARRLRCQYFLLFSKRKYVRHEKCIVHWDLKLRICSSPKTPGSDSPSTQSKGFIHYLSTVSDKQAIRSPAYLEVPPILLRPR